MAGRRRRPGELDQDGGGAGARLDSGGGVAGGHDDDAPRHTAVRHAGDHQVDVAQLHRLAVAQRLEVLHLDAAFLTAGRRGPGHLGELVAHEPRGLQVGARPGVALGGDRAQLALELQGALTVDRGGQQGVPAGVRRLQREQRHDQGDAGHQP